MVVLVRSLLSDNVRICDKTKKFIRAIISLPIKYAFTRFTKIFIEKRAAHLK